MKNTIIFIIFLIALHIPCTMLPLWYLIVVAFIDIIILLLIYIIKASLNTPYATDEQDNAETNNKLFNLLLAIAILTCTSCAATDNSCEAYKKDVFKHKKHNKTPYNNWTITNKHTTTPVNW